MRHLPIEHRADRARPIEQKIAGAIVAVHDRDALRRRRWIAPHPANGRAHDRLRLELVLVDTFSHLSSSRSPRRVRRGCRMPRQLRRRHIARAMLPEDREELLADLAADARRKDRRPGSTRAVQPSTSSITKNGRSSHSRFASRERARRGTGTVALHERAIGRELDLALRLDQASTPDRAGRSARARRRARRRCARETSRGSPRRECATARRHRNPPRLRHALREVSGRSRCSRSALTSLRADPAAPSNRSARARR